MNMKVVIRPLRTHAEYRACVALQKETWGTVFTEMVPPSLLLVSQKIGGVAAGAFDENETLVGFVFGLTGVKDGRLVHWSDMLAVRPERRDHGIGKRLKLFQREQVLALGVRTIYWTFDPLVARNAHLNFNHLGVTVEEYVPDMYDSERPSDLHRGLALDRLVVAWHISPDTPPEAPPDLCQLTHTRFARAAIINAPAAQAATTGHAGGALPLHERVRLEIPADIQALKEHSLATAQHWQAAVRAAFLFYLHHGYRVAGFYRDPGTGRCFYGLHHGTAA
ncbi:MAG: GNAT family N-acetyltransferase [candidate division KSB1 bacterium]|nr:GNAT family N-acetyltransferase [candidate division KSB1 bacterium]MDZ7275018.1 GNAT family N-acetyltransferase [candidate division KSB1 bacterium]MDZ7286533.1 GNAT family N-acetyltransferase [candidate division KSB1 bacterium]MDZ7299303.1 GNAT family N-acetyltransferase [candidate division KSB1 bacterium]MDZ7306974.1 GNAT family N-acetyltransferase [candidate division KSB1 bacterium]